MCELMGLSFARPISADFSIREFAVRGKENADGWGLAWYPDRAVAVVKEPFRWGQTPYTAFLETYPGLRSPLYIAHVRRKTVGGESTHADTHPFTREWGGRDYCFAHNGTLRGLVGQWRLGRFHPVGHTDSEWAFCYLMEAIACRQEMLATPESWQWLHWELGRLNELGPLNCLLSDGQRLFCYHDRTGHKGLSFRILQQRVDHERRLEDEEVKLELAEDDLNHGFVVATNPLSSGAWSPFEHAELMVLEAGRLRFSSHRTPADSPLLSCQES